jgi:HSP20 family protein
MTLVRFDLGNDIDDLRREVNRIFAGFPLMTPSVGNGFSRWVPAMDTVEKDGELCISIDVPGMEEKDLDVEVVENRLTIRGKRELKRDDTSERWHRYERASGAFERTLEMPGMIDPASVKAGFDCGVLTVTLPSGKAVPSPAQHIQITSGSAR